MTILGPDRCVQEKGLPFFRLHGALSRVYSLGRTTVLRYYVTAVHLHQNSFVLSQQKWRFN